MATRGTDSCEIWQHQGARGSAWLHEISLYYHAKFGEDRTRAPAVDAKIWCLSLFFCLSRSEAGVLWGHNSNIYCVTVSESILMRFYHFFQKGSAFQRQYMILIFLANGATNSEKLRSKMRKVQKSVEKFVRTTLYK